MRRALSILATMLLLPACSGKDGRKIVVDAVDQAGGSEVTDGDACSPSCGGRDCGDDGCGGTCGTCPDGDVCRKYADGASYCCTPNCTIDGFEKECGDDDCGGTCGECPEGSKCVTMSCTFEGGYCFNAEEQCPKYCKEQGAECGEVSTAIAMGSPMCQCGSCADGEVCLVTALGEGGTCCTPTCADGPYVSPCGGDGCGGSCGECPQGYECLQTDYDPDKSVCFSYEDDCPDLCLSQGVECGELWTGLGEGPMCQCGSCADGETCLEDGGGYDGTCCTPVCDGVQCGDDGCGGTCGECDDGIECTDDACDDGVCTSDLADDCCLISGKYYPAGDPMSKYSCLGCQPDQDQFGWSDLPDGTLCGSSDDLDDEGYKECLQGLCCNPYFEACWDTLCNCSVWVVYGGCQSECEMLAFDDASYCLMHCGGDCCNEDSDCPDEKPSCMPISMQYWVGPSPTGRCVEGVAYPQCWTKADCAPDEQCFLAPLPEDCGFCDVPCPDLESGVCVIPGVCGNGACDPQYGEDHQTCPVDCPAGPDGDGVCGPGENCANSPTDCGPCCPNGGCEPPYGETCQSCPEDCPCLDGEVCFDGACCLPECDDNCGDNGCGGSCAEPVPEGCTAWLGTEECEAFGGLSWYGPCSKEDFGCVCGCPTGDSGCPCTSSAQCQGVCVTYLDEGGGGLPGDCTVFDEGVCSYYHYMLGCMCVLDGNGEPDGGCWD